MKRSLVSVWFALAVLAATSVAAAPPPRKFGDADKPAPDLNLNQAVEEAKELAKIIQRKEGKIGESDAQVEELSESVAVQVLRVNLTLARIGEKLKVANGQQREEFATVERQNQTILASLVEATRQLRVDAGRPRGASPLERMLSALVPSADAAVVIPCVAAIQGSGGAAIAAACGAAATTLPEEWNKFRKKWDEEKSAWRRFLAVVAFVAKAG